MTLDELYTVYVYENCGDWHRGRLIETLRHLTWAEADHYMVKRIELDKSVVDWEVEQA